MFDIDLSTSVTGFDIELSPNGSTPTTYRTNVKISSVFNDYPVLIKIAGNFIEKELKVKIGGSFV